MRSGLLSDLVGSGYELFLEGDRIRYRYLKPGDPPDTMKPLIDELKENKAEAVNILKMGNIITPDGMTQSQSTTMVSWPPETQTLITWFLAQEPPKAPFHLEPHRYIVDPAKFFSALGMDIEAGSEGPRGRYGIVLQDLINLKKILH
jgi:hypothetical protein